MRRTVLFAAVVLSIVFESTFFIFFSIRGVLPNISMLLILCLALFDEEGDVLWLGLAAGLMKDVVVGRMVGISALTFMLIGYTLFRLNRKFFEDHLTTPLLISIFATLFHESVYLLFVFLLGYPVNVIDALTGVWLIQLAYNFLLVTPVFFSVRKLLKWRVMNRQY